MGFFSSFINLDWKTFKPFDVLKGCASSFLVDFQKNESSKTLESIIKYRLHICNNCYMNDNNFCQNDGSKTIKNVETQKETIGCGCNLTCKSALLGANCPASKWKAFVE